MSNSAIPRAFLKNSLQNGVGRYICQLQRVTLNFCKSSESSLGMRDFIEKHLLDFTRENPGVVVYVKPRRHRGPTLAAEYLNGGREVIHTANMEVEQVCKWLEHLRTRSGVQIVHLSKLWQTHSPSVQGVWHPFLHKDPALAVTTLPAPHLYRAKTEGKSATDIVLEEGMGGEEGVEGAGARKVGQVDDMVKE
ncbi:large ribosomal subunit protein mL43-like [Babylonia areolata]|uniref:large ribosomal subunit protein mL43-like n=1 Tax=Babylonia areolata TaxID=304850 RepID=UPI003FD2FE18